jgi:adenylyltransferase/sulfurtransferase
LAGIPVVSAAAVHFEGQLMVILPGVGNPCYRCYLPEAPPSEMLSSTQETGILGAVAGVMGVLQSMEAIKLILSVGEVLSHRLLIYDGLGSGFLSVDRIPDPQCALCGRNPQGQETRSALRSS